MRIDITSRPAYALAYVHLDVDESVHAEPGALVAMSHGIEVAARATGGVGRSVMRQLFVQEHFFQARYTAHLHGAWIALAPARPGDVTEVDIHGDDDVLIESGSFLAHSAGVNVTARAGSLQTVVLREGATVIRASGAGALLVSSYGAIERFELGPGEEIIVDTGHLVCWSASMGLRVGPLSGIISAALTRDGIVGQLTGPGVVYVQTRAEQQLRSWVLPKRYQNLRR